MEEKSRERVSDLATNELLNRDNKTYDPGEYLDSFLRRMKAGGVNISIIENPNKNRQYPLIESIVEFNTDDRKTLGHIWYIYDDNTNLLTISTMIGKDRDKYSDQWKPTGIGSALLAYLLRKHPRTARIEGKLRNNNLAQYLAGIDAGLSPVDSLRATAAFKIRDRFGFSKIDLSKWEEPKKINFPSSGEEVVSEGILATQK